jgi:hypothetical protein
VIRQRAKQLINLLVYFKNDFSILKIFSINYPIV